ncbi:hypothetical protein BX600DRAFT_442666 [Xylariales sp. PMI_506]|nr:hypothetical protein BX600DRAFT_442666 [Xylariales sp. PMI_506]
MIIHNPTEQEQQSYNQIVDRITRPGRRRPQREPVETHSSLLPPPARPRDSSTAPSITTESQLSETLSPASVDLPEAEITDVDINLSSSRPRRGRRGGPLDQYQRIQAAVKRKFGFVCPRCKDKRVRCNHYDLSKFEENYSAHLSAVVDQSTSQSTPRLISSEQPRPTTAEGGNMLFGIATTNYTTLGTSSGLEDDFGEPSQHTNRLQNIQFFVTNFDVAAVAVAPGTLETSYARSYNPGLGTTGPVQQESEHFPIGSEIPGQPQRWRCEYTRHDSSLPSAVVDDCGWTGTFKDLEEHFASKHHGFQDSEYWCQCACSAMTFGCDPPLQCIAAECYESSWTRWYYGHSLTESTLDSAPALTQSGESDSGHSFDNRGTDNQWGFGGAGSASYDMWGANGGSFDTGSGYHQWRASNHAVCGQHQHGSTGQEDCISKSHSLVLVSRCRYDKQSYGYGKTPEASWFNLFNDSLTHWVGCSYRTRCRISWIVTMFLITWLALGTESLARLYESPEQTFSRRRQLSWPFILAGLMATWFFLQWGHNENRNSCQERPPPYNLVRGTRK